MDDIYEPRPAGSLGRLIVNLLTLLVLLATAVSGLLMTAVFLNPYMSINPYPPPTLPPTLGWPTPTNTPSYYLPATWTATVTLTPRATITGTPTEVPTETPVPTEIEGTPGITATLAPYAYAADPQIAMQNSFINALGCSWMGVGGQVFDLSGRPVQGQNVQLGGTLAGASVQLTTLTGTAGVLGDSGYVFDLAEEPVASVNTLWIQLVDTAGLPISDRAYITTFDSCEQNFVLVNWRQVQ